MKTKIKEALQQGYKNLGLSDEVFEGVATSAETFIKSDEDINGFVNSEVAKSLLRFHQAEADRKRANNKKKPEDVKPDAPEDKNAPKAQDVDIAAIVANAVAEAIKPVNDELTRIKSEQSAKAAVNAAEQNFNTDAYVKKYADEAKDAWERAMELYEYNKDWTADQIKDKAMSYFNKAVAKKGVDTKKPLESETDVNKPKTDFTDVKKMLEKQGIDFSD